MKKEEVIKKVLENKKLRKIALAQYPEYWANFYYPEYFWLPEDYKQILKRIVEWYNIIWLWYRWCAKTTLVRKLLALYIAEKKKRFIRRTSFDLWKAADNVTSLSNMIIWTQESRFVWDYGHLYHAEIKDKEFKQKEERRMTWFTTSNGVIVKSNSLRKSTRWLNQFLGDRTARPDCDVLDDIDDDENTTNPDTIKKNYNKIVWAIFWWNTSQKIVLWNVIYEDWVIPRLIEKYKDNPKRKIIRTKLVDGWVIHRPQRFVLTDKEADRINRDKEDDAQKVTSIESLKWDGRDWFGANYMLEPMRNDIKIIEDYWIKKVDPVFAPWWDTVFLSIDSAESEKDWTDPIGIVVGRKYHKKKKRHILHARQLKWREKDEDKVKEVVQFLVTTYWIKCIIVENKAWGITLRRLLIKSIPWIVVVLYDPWKQNKWMRLRHTQPYIEGGHITFAIDMPQDFIDQLVKFPSTEHYDMMDAFTAMIEKTEAWVYDIASQSRSVKKEVENNNPTDTMVNDIIDKYKKDNGDRWRFTNF